MSLLSSADVSQMRSVLNESLPDTAVISTSTITDDAGGGGTLSWTPSGTVACRRAAINGTEREAGERISSEATWIITLPAETIINRAQQITIDGTSYSVVAIRAPRSWELSRRVEAKENT